MRIDHLFNGEKQRSTTHSVKSIEDFARIMETSDDGWGKRATLTPAEAKLLRAGRNGYGDFVITGPDTQAIVAIDAEA